MVSTSQRNPPAQSQPPVDERIVEPETREEMLHGERLWAAPANRAHAELHTRLAYLLQAHVADDYCAAIHLLTRTAHDCDFAFDACILAEAPDPVTGGRQLEELAFDICSKETLHIPTIKARELARRGVRRVFCLLIPDDEEEAPEELRQRAERNQMLAWSRATDGWEPMLDEAALEDRCFVHPLPVPALLGITASDDAVAEALRARRDRSLAAARAEGRAESLLMLLEGRGLSVSSEARQRILACTDLKQLDRWIRRAVSASTLEDLWD